MACSGCNHGPGYATPMDAFKSGSREKILYVPCIVPDKSRPDYLATIDVDPSSEHYCQVIHRAPVSHVGDEVHHMNYNSCSSCYDKPNCRRDKLILPCLNSSRIYTFDLSKDPRKPTLFAEVDTAEMHALDVSTPHTPHCLPSGEVMISTMGDRHDNAKGAFVLLDGKTFKPKGVWNKTSVPFGYDNWYQPRHDVMISSAWGAPSAFKKGFNPTDVDKGLYGDSIYVWKWSTGELLQTVKLGPEGLLPLEVRFFHHPDRDEGFVGCALSGTVWRFYNDKSSNSWKAEKAVSVANRKVSNWILPELPAIISDLLLSMDDRYLYIACWLQGEVRQYDVMNSKNATLSSKILLGGILYRGGPVTAADDQPVEEKVKLKGVEFRGGPQMIQLSLDGRRLYGTTSLYSSWDRQFYPDMIRDGAMLFMVDVDHKNGKMRVNEDFLIDFGKEPGGPVLAHEIRYPGGDCTSDIWK